jgi:RND family efflux transporter MFP subunit
VEVGQVVGAGQVVLTIAADGEREVVISIPEARVAELRKAKSMTVSLWANPGKPYGGKLRELAPDTDEVTRTYEAKVTVLDPDASLLLGMTASVRVPDVQGSTAVRLPMTAVYDNKGKPLVWVVDPQTSQVAQRFVTLAAAEKDTILIAEGLKDGEIVVTAGVHMLHEGQKVKIVDAPTAPAAGGRP